MSRINSNVPSLIAQANLNRANSDLDVRLQRLATGVRINRGKDDPAGLIVSQRLGSEINGLEQAVKNSERASSVIGTAEASLAEVNDLLNSIKGLIVEAANTGAISKEERQANQLQIDSAIESITRISNSASFGGLKLLNGELDYVLSGLSSAAISKATVLGANLAGQSSLSVKVDTVASAQTARLYLRGDQTGNGFAAGQFLSSVTLEVAGPKGVQTLQILSGQTFSQAIQAINNFTPATGLSANFLGATSANGLVFSSVEYGSGAFVSVRRIGGPVGGGFFSTYKYANNTTPPGASFAVDAQIGTSNFVVANRDEGRNVSAIINGALGTGDGLKLTLPTTDLSLELLLDTTFATTIGSSTTFSITGGGALYQLGGSVNSTQQIHIALPSIAASRLGGTLIGTSLAFLSSVKSGGSNDLNTGNFENASAVINTSIDEISLLRGRLGALERNTLETNVRSVQTAVENLSASRSRIRDADFARESSELTRGQILASASSSTLALANQRAQNVLQLLRQ